VRHAPGVSVAASVASRVYRYLLAKREPVFEDASIGSIVVSSDIHAGQTHFHTHAVCIEEQAKHWVELF
jgi:hypothetical protein